MSTGNIRTLRNQSGTVGYRTLNSILASSGGGAGSFRRLYGYYRNQNQDISMFYQALGIRRGQNQHK
jgi:hypothetical protein